MGPAPKSNLYQSYVTPPSKAELNCHNRSQPRGRFCGLEVGFFKSIQTSLTGPFYRSIAVNMSWFDQVTAKAAQVQSLEELETETRDKLEQRMFVTRSTIFVQVENKLLMSSYCTDVPHSFTLKELAEAARKPLNSALSTKSRVSEGTTPIPTFPATNMPQEARAAPTQLLSVLACLRYEGRITPEPSTDNDAVQELALNIAKLIAPVVTQDQSDGTSTPSQRHSEMRLIAPQLQARTFLETAKPLSKSARRTLGWASPPLKHSSNRPRTQ